MDFEKFNFDKFDEEEVNRTERPRYYQKPNYDNVVSTIHWVLLILGTGIAGALPVIGPIIVLIVLLILAFGDVNQNLKNYARANLILLLVAIIFLLIFNLGFLLEIFKFAFK